MLTITLVPDGAKAENAFVSASFVRALFEDAYPWFLEGSVQEQTHFEVESGDLKLFGFAPTANDGFKVSAEAAFFLVTLLDGGC
jgi:hypothetical protein